MVKVEVMEEVEEEEEVENGEIKKREEVKAITNINQEEGGNKMKEIKRIFLRRKMKITRQ